MDERLGLALTETLGFVICEVLTLSPLADINKDRRYGMFSVRETAAKLGVTDRHVRFLLAKGVIPGKKLGHDWVVFALEYERKRQPKTRARRTAEREVGQGWEGTWTEGGL